MSPAGLDAVELEIAWAKLVAVVEEAVRYELEMYTFYRLTMERTQSHELREVLEDLFHKEEDHLNELDEKYHVHLEPQARKPPPDAEKKLSRWLFDGIDFADTDEHIAAVYDKAIAMEQRTRDYFQKRAKALPAGTEKELYRELAAEEEDHVALLATERNNLSQG